jgi:hypothetical protein
MASAVLNSSVLGATRFTGSPLDLPRRAHALLAERFPPARVKHKPLSILRQEARRALEQLLDAQQPPLARPDRDRLIEDVLGEAPGFGPLEELFRDESVKEIMLLAAAQVIVRKDSGWVPTSVRFRDPAHLRGYLRRQVETGEPFVSGGANGEGGFDVRMANGFRVIGLLPPDVLDTPPQAVLVRGLPHTSDLPTPTFPSASLSGWVPGSALVRTPAPRPVPPDPAGSGVMTVPVSGIPRPDPLPPPKTAPPRPAPLPMPDAAPVSEFYMPANTDPKERRRRRVSERIIRKCAAAGLYDLSAIPAAELQRVILAHVKELNAEQRAGMTDQEMQIVMLEIFTGMRR